MNEADMSYDDIWASITSWLKGAALKYAADMEQHDRDEMVFEVRRGEATIAQCADTICTWADEATRKVDAE